MKKYRGFFEDWFETCEAENEEEAQKNLKEKLLKEINEEKKPLIIWEED